MSHVPIIASTTDLPWAIRRAERYVESRAYVAQRAHELGVGTLIPSGWGIVAAGPSAAVREKAADKGEALPDGSFPIRNKSDLHNAIQAFGRAKDKDRAKRHIIKRARALGAVSELPEDWGVTASITAAGWNAGLHPRDRNGRFIEKLGLLNLFDGVDFGKPSLRAEAVGVRNEGGKDILTVRAKSVGAYGGKPRAVGDEFDVPADKVEAAPEKKATVHPVFTGEVTPTGPAIKGEPTDLKKAQDRADAAAAELAEAEASGDKARITKARTSNTAAKKNLEKQQALEDTAETDLMAQLEQSVAQLDATPEPKAEMPIPDEPADQAEYEAASTKVYEILDKRGLDYSEFDDGVEDFIQNEWDAGNKDPEAIANRAEDLLDFPEPEGSIDDAVEALMDELGPDVFDPADAKNALVEQGFDPDEVDDALDRFEENYNRGAIPTGQQPDDEEEDFEEESTEDFGFEDDGTNYDEDGTLSDDAEGSLEDDPDYAAETHGEVPPIKDREDLDMLESDEEPDILGEPLEDDFAANLEPVTEWEEGDSPIDDEVEYGKHILSHAASYEEVNSEDDYSDADLVARMGDLRTALSGDVGDPNVQDEVRVRADAVRAHLAEGYADDYELPKFGNGPASNHGIDDNAGDDAGAQAARKWEDANFDYLNSIGDDARIEIEDAIKDKDYARALSVMNDNYQSGEGHGDAIDSFEMEVLPEGSSAPPDVEEDADAEAAVAEQFNTENPQPTTDLYEAKDPEVQSAFDEWASAMRENGYTDEQIAQRVEFAQSSMDGNWRALTPEDAVARGTSNAQYGMARDRLAMFPVGDPGKIGFGGYEVWHTNGDGSKNSGRGYFPDKETAQAFIDASNAESDRKLQEQLDAVPAHIDKWAEGKDPFTIKQAALNIDASIPDFDPQDPAEADQLKIMQARKDRMEEILAKAPAPEADPAPEVAAPSGTDVDAAPNASASPQRLAIEQSLGTSATNKGLDKPNLESVFSASSPEDAHKALAAEMTRLKLGGKQRARMRQMLDIHFGDESGSSAAVSAKATADGLSEDNPLKAKLEAAVAKASPIGVPGSPGVSAPAPAPAVNDFSGLDDNTLDKRIEQVEAASLAASKLAMNAKTGTPATNQDAAMKKASADRLRASLSAMYREREKRRAAVQKASAPPKPAYSKPEADAAANRLASELAEMASEDPTGPWSSYASASGARDLVGLRVESIKRDLDEGAKYVTVKVPSGSEISMTRDDAWQLLMDLGIEGKA